MLGNLISLLVLLALVVLSGWLTFRAWRAKRWFVRWPGLVAGGLLTIVLAGATFLAVKGLAFMYILPHRLRTSRSRARRHRSPAASIWLASPAWAATAPMTAISSR